MRYLLGSTDQPCIRHLSDKQNKASIHYLSLTAEAAPHQMFFNAGVPQTDKDNIYTNTMPSKPKMTRMEYGSA